MSARTSIATVVILTAGLLAGEVRADCLDGHLEDFRITSILLAHTNTQAEVICSEGWIPDNDLVASGGVECFDYCEQPGGGSVECPGPAANFDVSTSANGYTITAHAKVRPNSAGHLQTAYAYICVYPRVAGG